MSKTQSMAQIAKQVGEHDTRLWRFVKHYVEEARKLEEHFGVEAVGIDEISKKGHNYIR